MKYMLLIHSGGESWNRFQSLPEEERGVITDEYLALAETPGVLSSNQLQPPTPPLPSVWRTARR